MSNNKCSALGCKSWANLPYTIGVSTTWPNKVGNALRAEAQSIVDSAKRVAEEYKLSPIYEGLHFAAGGVLVMYVGFKNK